MYLRSILLMLVMSVTALAGTFQSLGKPCHAFNVLASCTVKDPAGREWFVLSNTNEATGLELIFIDFHNNTAHTYRAPAGQGAWLLNQVPGNRLVAGTYYDGTLLVFDLKSMSFIKTIPFPGEKYFWTGVMGGDGRLYGGTYPGGKLGALNLTNYKLQDCGAPAPPNLYCRTVSVTPDGRLLCHFVTSNPVTKLFDPQTGKWSDPPASLKGVERDVVWNGYLLATAGWDLDKTDSSIAFQGPDFKPVNPLPFPTPPASAGPWSVDLRMTTHKTLYLRQGTAIYRYRPGEKNLTRIFDEDLHAGGISSIASDGTLLGLRGQDYVIVRPGQAKAQLLPIPAKASPRPIMFLRCDKQGRIWGGPEFGQTLFYADEATGKATNTGLICNSGGEVYDTAFIGRKVYAAAYVGGDIVEYDPSQPWDEWNGKNPKRIAHLTTRGYIRPVGGIHVGPDGMLYAGWWAKYGTYGGAVSITNPKTQKTDLIENPLGAQSIFAVAVNNKFIFVGTGLEGNGLPDKPNAKPQFGLLDRKTHKLLFQRSLGTSAIQRIIWDAKSRKAVVRVDGRLKIFNPSDDTFTDLKTPMAVQGVDGVGNGIIWAGGENALVRISLLDGKQQTFKTPANVDHLSVNSKGEVFFSSGAELFRFDPDRP